MNATDALLRRRLAAADAAWESAADRRAAVLAPLVATEGGDQLLFLVRPTTMRLHPGQIGFPGGRDAGDPTPAACALREVDEEIGVAAGQVTLLGSLPTRTSSSGLRVHCIVGRLADAALRLQAAEVARALWVPLARIVELERWQQLPPPPPFAAPADAKLAATSPHFRWHGDLVWGLTGRFARDLAEVLQPEPSGS